MPCSVIIPLQPLEVTRVNFVNEKQQKNPNR
jgi:hypothetical protein